MKKLLLATTMLVMAGGYAAADVSISGDARMGVVGSYNNVSDKTETTLSSRVRVKFSGSGTTDGGLAFGGSFRANDAAGAKAGTSGSVFISGGFGKITMGDVDSGDKAAVGQIDGGVGYTGLGSFNSVSYAADGGFAYKDGTGIAAQGETLPGDVGNADAAKVLYTYTVGGVNISASSAQLSNNANSEKTAYGLGASYTMGALTAAVGYGSSDISVTLNGNKYDGSVADTSVSAAYVMGATTVKAIYQDKEADSTNTAVTAAPTVNGSIKSMGLSVKHTIGTISLVGYGFSAKFETNQFPGKSATPTSYGIGASYDLGGGASLAAGWAHNEIAIVKGANLDTKGVEAFDAGVNFSF
ncbi:MAG: porin [Pseudomonadota bacterium]